MIVYDACRLIRERVPDAAQGQRKYNSSARMFGMGVWHVSCANIIFF